MSRPTNKKYAMNMSETQYKLMEDTRELIEAVTNAETVRRSIIFLEYVTTNGILFDVIEPSKEKVCVRVDLVYDDRSLARIEKLVPEFGTKSDVIRAALYAFNQAYKSRPVF
jgi:hypothetical protein